MATAVIRVDAAGASSTLKGLSKDFKKVDKSADAASKSADKFSSALKSMGDFALRQIVPMIVTFVDINRELEKQQILLKGVTGSANAGTKAFKQLIEFAAEAPFTMAALSDSFTRLTVSGLDPMDGSMRSLSDAIAAFGGGSDDMKYATLAIQQMAAKGVVSMEELRRQLAERIPSAVHDMARGLGMSYRELVEKVSRGEQMSMEAINAMLEQFKIRYAGAGKALMDSYDGALRQVKLRRDILLKDLADKGIWDELVEGMKGAADVLKGWHIDPKFQEDLQSISDGLSTMVGKLAQVSELIPGFVANVSNSLGFLYDGLFNFLDKIGFFADSVDKLLGTSGIFKDSWDMLGRGADIKIGIDAGAFDVKDYMKAMLSDAVHMFENDYESKVLALADKGAKARIQLEKEAREAMVAANIETLQKNEADYRQQIEELQRLRLETFKNEDSMTGSEVKAFDDIERRLKELRADYKNTVKELKDNDIEIDSSSALSSLQQVENALLEDSRNWEKYRVDAVAEYKKLQEEIKTLSEKIVDQERDLVAELRDLHREGMTDENAYDDQLKEIESIRKAAKEAGKAGVEGRKEELKLLRQAESLIRGLSTSAVKSDDVVSDKDVRNAKKVAESAIRAEKSNSSWAFKDQADKAIAEYNKLLAKQQAGAGEAVSAEEALAEKIKLTEEVKKRIIQLDKDQLKILKESESQLKAEIAMWDEALMDVKGTITDTRTSIVDLEDDMTKASKSFITDTNAMTAAVKKLNDEIDKTPSDYSSSGGNNTYGRAAGGPVSGGTEYLVGEKGPELFVPNNSGTIIPNNQLGTRDTVNINLAFNGSEPVQVQGSRQTVDQIQRAFRDSARYAA